MAIGFAAALIVWVVLERTDDEPSSVAGPIAVTTTATTPAPSVARPAIASVAELEAAASGAVPIYWAGPRSGRSLEFTRAPGGPVIVRYLPPNARAGASGSFLTIATYPRPNGYREVLNAAKEPNTKTIKLAGGGIAVYNSDEPTNLHLAYPGQRYQIEVFAPERDLARELVTVGAVRPVG